MRIAVFESEDLSKVAQNANEFLRMMKSHQKVTGTHYRVERCSWTTKLTHFYIIEYA